MKFVGSPQGQTPLITPLSLDFSEAHPFKPDTTDMMYAMTA